MPAGGGEGGNGTGGDGRGGTGGRLMPDCTEVETTMLCLEIDTAVLLLMFV